MNLKHLFDSPYIILLVNLLFMAPNASAQFVIKGRILDAESLEPLPYATVFISNSSSGDVTDKKGEFEISVSAGNHELVISHVGYEAFNYKISTMGLHEFYQFRIMPSAIELEESEVIEKRDKTWYDNLEVFKEYFLGKSVNASRCKIKNPEALIIDAESTPNVLRVRAKDILEIENLNLGYTIKLTGVELNRDSTQITYSGYPYFIEEQIPKRKQRKVEENREVAYQGSVMHFIRTLYHGTTTSEGFDVYFSEKIPNPSKPSEEEIENLKLRINDISDKMNRMFFENELKKANLPDSIDSPIGIPIDPSILIRSTADGKRFITHSTPVYIVFNKEIEDPVYVDYSLRNISKTIRNLGLKEEFSDETDSKLPQVSLMNMRAKAVQIFENGSYFHPFDLFFKGYMAWEKIGDTLPLDYGLD